MKTLEKAYNHYCSIDVKLYRDAHRAERQNFFNPSPEAAQHAKNTALGAAAHYELTNMARGAYHAAKRGSS